jgi:hypothetical protein
MREICLRRQHICGATLQALWMFKMLEKSNCASLPQHLPKR